MTLSYFESKIFGKVCYGFRSNNKGLVETVPENAEIVESIFALYLNGNSLEAIQQHLYKKGIASPSGKEIWSRDVLNKLLNNYKYTFGIIDCKTFFKVEEMKSNNCRNPNRDIEDGEEWDEQQRQSCYGLTL